jgi:hypothetical protein
MGLIGKLEASTNLLPRMAESYREFGVKRTAEGDEAAGGAGFTAADAIDELAERRKQVETLTRQNERMSAALAKIFQATMAGPSEDTLHLIRDLADLKDAT